MRDRPDVVRALVEALGREVTVGLSVEDEQLELPSRCAGWTIRQVLDHSIGVTAKFADFAAGTTDEPHAPAGDLLGADHRMALRDVRARAVAAWASADMARTCRLPFGTFRADAAAGINLFDVLAHTWDVASAVGVELDEHDELWDVGRQAACDVIGRGRDPMHYAAEVPVSPDASPMARFLGYLGRPTP